MNISCTNQHCRLLRFSAVSHQRRVWLALVESLERRLLGKEETGRDRLLMRANCTLLIKGTWMFLIPFSTSQQISKLLPNLIPINATIISLVTFITLMYKIRSRRRQLLPSVLCCCYISVAVLCVWEQLLDLHTDLCHSLDFSCRWLVYLLRRI